MPKIEDIDAAVNVELATAMARVGELVPGAEAKDVLASGMRFFVVAVVNTFGMDSAVASLLAAAEALDANRISSEADTKH